MCYVVCSARFDSVDTLPNVPPPPMTAQSKKEKRRFRKSLKAVVDKIMCRGTPKADCPCLSVVEEKASEEESGDFVRIDVDVDVVTDAPSLLNTSFGDEQSAPTETSVSILPDLGPGLESAPELVAGVSSIAGEVTPESDPARQPFPLVDTSRSDAPSVFAVEGDISASTPAPIAHRRALDGNARDEVVLARRGQNHVSKEPSRDRPNEKKVHGTARAPLTDVTNRGTKVDSQIDGVIRAPIEATTTTAFAPSPVLGLVEPDACAPCPPVLKDLVVPSEIVSTPIADFKRVDEESALSQPAVRVIHLQDKANLETPRTALTVLESPHPLPLATEVSVACDNPATPVLPSLVPRVDATPVGGVSIGLSGTPDLFSP